MREFKFRGQRTSDRKWIYGNLRIHLIDGYLEKDEKRYFIEYDWMDKFGKVYRNCEQVIPSTIGQFIGLHDKYKVDMYEGDILELEDRYVCITYSKNIHGYDCYFYKFKQCDDNNFKFNGLKPQQFPLYEVVGNIHDETISKKVDKETISKILDDIIDGLD